MPQPPAKGRSIHSLYYCKWTQYLGSCVSNGFRWFIFGERMSKTSSKTARCSACGGLCSDRPDLTRWIRCQLACCPSLFLEGKTWYIGKTVATPYQLNQRGKPPEDSVFLDDLTCNTIGYFCGSKYRGLPLPPKLVDEYLNQPIHVGCGDIYCDTCEPGVSHQSLLCHPQR